jgi:hypothetical protein
MKIGRGHCVVDMGICSQSIVIVMYREYDSKSEFIMSVM